MQTKDRINYLSALELQFPKFEYSKNGNIKSLRASRGSRGAEVAGQQKEQAFLADKSLVSFISEVSGQNREDVLNSTLLAQLAANKKFPHEDNVLDWYNAFIEVLSRIGWIIEDSQVSTFQASQDIFEIENAIVEILTSAFGGNYMVIIAKTLESIKKLSDKDGKIVAFERNTHSLSKGCFQIGLAVEKNDTVSLQLGTFLLTSSNEIKKILFFKSSKDKTNLQYSSRRATLNPQLYSSVRDAVLSKLGKDVSKYVAEIEI